MTVATTSVELPDEAATLELGRRLGAAARAGDVLALHGTLGAGKTTLVHGLAAALGIVGPVPSPTFVLIREYTGRLPLAHVDAYRLGGSDEALAIGLDELLGGPGVTAVEWAEIVDDLLPAQTLHVHLSTAGAGRRAELRGPELGRWLAGAGDAA